MKRLFIAALMLATASQAFSQSRADGFYKDIFMDCGIKLNVYDDLPAAKLLNLSMERICTYDNELKRDPSEYEVGLMNRVFVGCETDENGILLYPDGSPRFKAIYCNGGKAGSHGKGVTPRGLENLRTFYENGGSYVGTCAGAYFCSAGVLNRDGKVKKYDTYLGIFPGYVTGTGLERSATGVTVEKDSPLLKYYDFGGDFRIDSVRHNGGCFLPEEKMPMGTEILCRYIGDTLKLEHSIHQTVNAWAFKAACSSGRLVVTGSHPERMISGDRLQMFAGMIRYALDGVGAPGIKAMLRSGEAREMTKTSGEADPDYTCIGDRQYHHFSIEIPEGAESVEIELSSVVGRTDYDLFIYASDEALAFNDVAKWFNINTGVDKKLVIEKPKAGMLRFSVFCDTTVTAVDTAYGELYTGRVDVLNGVPYIIKATVR